VANTVVTAAAHPVTNPLPTGPNDDGTYLVQPGAFLSVTKGLGPNSVILDDGGTVIFASSPPAKESGTIILLDKANLVFGGLQFIAPATTETFKIDGTSTIGIAGMPNSEAATRFIWGTNISANTSDPTAGSFNINFADLMPPGPVGLNVGLIGGAPNSLPAWSFYQAGGPTNSFSGIFSANTLVPAGALNTTPNPTF
jgi:hypothetical protein